MIQMNCNLNKSKIKMQKIDKFNWFGLFSGLFCNFRVLKKKIKSMSVRFWAFIMIDRMKNIKCVELF